MVVQVLEGATAVALSAAICYLGILAEAQLQLPGTLIPAATAITVAFATLAPRVLAPLVSSAEGIAAILMNIFFATVRRNKLGQDGQLRPSFQLPVNTYCIRLNFIELFKSN